jgi:hypothetical protein
MDPAGHERECARRLVNILFEKTGLATILHETPAVTLDDCNWINFTAQQPVSSAELFRLVGSNGRRMFVRDLFTGRSEVRSRTSPSLHLTNLDSGEGLRGHVDAHYWVTHPLAHANEFFRKRTASPSDLLRRLQD